MTGPLDVALSVDALSPRLTGIGRYCLELVRGLPLVPTVRNIDYFRGPHWLEDPQQLLTEGWQPSSKPQWLNRFLSWQRHRRLARAIVHGTNFFLPEWAERGVVTVHDLSVLLYPETHPVERIRDFDRHFERSLRQAARIITDSEAIRSEMITILGVSSDLVVSVPLGVSPLPVPPDHSAIREFGLRRGRYCLCVSTFEPRKRIDRLVAAYRHLPVPLRSEFPLVLAGASGWRNEALNHLIDGAQAEGWLIRVDFVPQGSLDALYAGATLFVYPSRYEGFGLPPIEAMRHGVPTIVGNATALVEVTMGAARIVDADDEVAFAAALADALEDKTWQARAGMAGRKIAENYRWSDTINQTVDVYQSIGR